MSSLTEQNQRKYDKSPMNYIGGKYKMLPQLFEIFPKDIDVFVDLFAGGGDVCSNVKANVRYANDINPYLIELYKEFQDCDMNVMLNYIDKQISLYGLSKTNQEGFLKFREDFNVSNNKNPLDLFLLICYSFNHQFRLNNRHEYNSSFGKNRSSYNEEIKKNLIKFKENIEDIIFYSDHFKEFNYSLLDSGDFLYADPPYLITTGNYNDGKRGFEGWSKRDDLDLFMILDALNARGIKFALSNVIKHKGIVNEELIDWSQKYNVHYMKKNYKNSSYHGKNTEEKTVEVLITNY